MKIRIHLLQGCCDGASWEVPDLTQPKLLYRMWPGYNENVKAISDQGAREVLRDELSVLAYRLVGRRMTKDSKYLELRYVRFPRKDKPLPADAPAPSL